MAGTKIEYKRKRFLGIFHYYRCLIISKIFYYIDRKLTIYGKGVLFAFVFSMFFTNLIMFTVIFQISVISFLFLFNAVLWTIYFKPRLS